MITQSFPRVIVTGMYRSGSTRLYNVIRQALLARHPSARFGNFSDIAELERELHDPSAAVFKEHALSDALIRRVLDGDVRAVATIREPLPALVSLCATFSWSPELATEEMDRALTSLERIAGEARIYRYTTAVAGGPACVRMVFRDTGIRGTWLESAKLSRRWNRRSVTRHVAGLADNGFGSHDRVTLFHPAHVAKTREIDEPAMSSLRHAAGRLRFDERVAALERLAK